MPRVSASPATRRRKKKVLDLSKGFRGGRSKLYKTARETVERSLVAAYRGRKERKRDFRNLWIARINAAARSYGVTYSVFMDALIKNNVKLNRKVLADMAIRDTVGFKAVMDKVIAAK